MKGTLLPGDQLLLCTGWLCIALDEREILQILLDSSAPSDALLRLAKRAGNGGGDIAAIVLRAEKADEA